MLKLSRVLALSSFCLLLGSVAVRAQNTGYSPTYSGTGNGCQAGGTCYYIDIVGGSDTNSGLSKEAAWAHAPGMTCATGKAASHSFSHTDEFILKGGDIWPYSCVSGTWFVTSGSSKTRNSSAYPGIYIGYDPTWNAGTVNSVPVADPGVCTAGTTLAVSFSGGGGSGAAATANVETDQYAAGDLEFVTVTSGGSGYTSDPTVTFTATSGSCSKFPTAYPDIYSPIIDGSAGTWGSGGMIPQMFFTNVNYLTLDHIEFAHMHFSTANNCPKNAPNMIDMFATGDVLQNSFIHDFQGAPLSGLVGNCDDNQTSAVYMNGQPFGDVLNNNILNNYESEAAGCNNGYKGNCVQSTAIDNAQVNTNNVYTNWRGALYVVDSVGNNYVTAGNKMWGSLLDPGTQHGDTFYLHTGGLVYNNILRDIYPGTAAFYFETTDGSNLIAAGEQFYIFNNVIWNIGTSTPPIGITSEFSSSAATAISPTPFFYIANNSFYSYQGTADCVNAGQWYGASGVLSLHPGIAITLYNNHCISTQGSVHWFDSNASAAVCKSSPVGCGVWNGLESPNSAATEKAIDPFNVIDKPPTAVSQGYTAKNNLSPMASANDTVAFAGSPNSQNLTNLCSTSLNGVSISALCSDMKGNPRPVSGGWQAGAYQFNSGLVPGTPNNVKAVPVPK